MPRYSIKKKDLDAIDKLKIHLDVNECSAFGGHVCSFNADCENTVGSFKCRCHKGYNLNADGRNCDGNRLNSGQILPKTFQKLGIFFGTDVFLIVSMENSMKQVV